MKPLYKIILLCFTIFVLGLLITKISIDRTFNKVQCDQVVKTATSKILLKTIQV